MLVNKLIPKRTSVSLTKNKSTSRCFRLNPMKYIVFVLFLSFTLEFPRWFEFQLKVTETGSMVYWTTELNENPDYIRYA